MVHPGSTPDPEQHPEWRRPDQAQSTQPIVPTQSVGPTQPVADQPGVAAPTAAFPVTPAPTQSYPTQSYPGTAPFPPPGSPAAAGPYPPPGSPGATGPYPPFGPPPGQAGGSAGKRGAAMPILAAVAVLLLLGAVVMGVLYATQSTALDDAKTAIGKRDATIATKDSELAALRRDLQSTKDDLAKSKTDLTGAQNQADELKRQREVVVKCFKLAVEADQAPDRATANKKAAEAEAACTEAAPYLL